VTRTNGGKRILERDGHFRNIADAAADATNPASGRRPVVIHWTTFQIFGPHDVRRRFRANQYLH
jgi:hypothetical protein